MKRRLTASPPRRIVAALFLLSTAVLLLGVPQIASADDSHSEITASGSSWSANAINQWIADVQSNGLRVVFTANGSASGRKDFALSTTDFGVSDIGYQGVDPVSQEADSSSRAYRYLPIVAGGTSFPYHLVVAGQLVRNLRLSGLTLAKIFTNQITNWNDPAITADNNGHGLPSLPIIPVVHSEGSGSSAQFTKYLATDYANLWTPYNGGHDTLNEYYPVQDGSAMIAQNGSDGVMNYISSAAANGSIGFDEYSYALSKNYPVVKLENAAGYYTLPTQYNVAVALTQAIINTDSTSPDYLLQDLHNVYTYNDPRTYALSSYSYEIIPTGANDQTMTTAKRQTLSDFDYYSICQGQKEMGPIGYSPLPVNLVQAGFDQIAQLKAADPSVDLAQRDVTTCSNPTFVAGNPSANYLAQVAPQPPACDQTGQGPCAGPGDTGTTTTPAAAAAASSSSKAGTATGAKSTSKTGARPADGVKATAKSGGAAAPPATGTKAVAPLAIAPAAAAAIPTAGGAAVADGSSGGAAQSAGAVTGDPAQGDQPAAATDPNATADNVAEVATVSTELSSNTPSSVTSVLGPVAGLELLLVVLLPPLVARRLRRRRAGQ